MYLRVKLLILCSCIFVASCATGDFHESKYLWELTRQANNQISIYIVDNLQEYCNVPVQAKACAVQKPPKCLLYFTQEIRELPADIVKHEILHCRGYSHQAYEK